ASPASPSSARAARAAAPSVGGPGGGTPGTPRPAWPRRVQPRRLEGSSAPCRVDHLDVHLGVLPEAGGHFRRSVTLVRCHNPHIGRQVFGVHFELALVGLLLGQSGASVSAGRSCASRNTRSWVSSSFVAR